MKCIVAGQQALSVSEFAELALGTPLELWLGVEGESEVERAARLDAARDILSDPDFATLPDDLVRLAARVIEEHPELFDVVPLSRRRAARRGVAA
ncbi:hypothetical protein IAG44_16245 [Streptomyces roseirectus]|uniref:Uncharacterized protein n=1 Tax=Streptomyces roseirectus TaxID=2768066 RepID=A0A7H0IDG5_9ACTN|nr:hypothetical protein [Streptomyces roseirectus]QNP70831.1 hypothetical protein IAG44_16245 [Streptomyces roseirectus]